MGKKSKLIGEAGGVIARRVGKKLNFGDFSGSAAQAVRKNTDDIVKRVKRVSKRRKFLGNTPGKNSRTGREVIERMRASGDVVTQRGQEMLKWTDPATGKTEFIPLSKCDMGHAPVDAVTYWNTTGMGHGAKSPEVRKWMLDSGNYELQPSSWNRSQGAKLGQTYKDL
ncbi:MAG: GH-E family nuclease [Arachnia sp.]